MYLKLIDWRFAGEGSKAADMSEKLACLGVSFDLSTAAQYEVSIANANSRIKEFTNDVNSGLSTSLLKKSTANKLRWQHAICGEPIAQKTCSKRLGLRVGTCRCRKRTAHF